MDLFSTFNPETLIQSIPEARTTGQILEANQLSFLKEKLLVAETSTEIIRAARGEGRKGILNTIVQNDSILFDWGIKSQHAFYETSDEREFLEPNNLSADHMKAIISKYQEALAYRFRRHFSPAQDHILTNEAIVNHLKQIIDENRYSCDTLLLIKDWLCCMLHTAGDQNFKNISPWVSASTGCQRYKTAYFFGKGVHKFINQTDEQNTPSRFVIFDTWVPTTEEHFSFEKTSFLIESLANIGLPWFPDTHHEIMLKYAIYPHRLVGYYYIENDNLLYYYLNPHYWNMWNDDSSFQIGNYLFIDQSNVQFPAENPYRIIYSRSGRNHFVHDRR